MTKRQEEIIKRSILLFNEKGVSNVKLTDITVALNISLGNLTYYYKTKKDLVAAILEFMVADQKELEQKSEQLLSEDDWIDLIKGYLLFQLKYCFFYRDILDLDALNEQAKSKYKKEVNNVIEFNKLSINRSVEKKYIRKEPRQGLYDGIAENVWSIYQAWFIKRAVFGADQVSLEEPLIAILNLFYPYATKKGLKAFEQLRIY